MLLILIINLLIGVSNGQDNEVRVSKPYMILPVPLDLPNRNDKSEQCWLRIEDTELVATFSVFCYITKTFLNNYLYDYNSRKMTEDGAVVSVWEEEGKELLDGVPFKTSGTAQKVMKDWKVTTFLDPVTQRRIYVSQKADCKLIMYTREGMLNQKVDCEKLLFYLNTKMSERSNSAGSTTNRVVTVVFMVISLLLMVFFQ